MTILSIIAARALRVAKRSKFAAIDANTGRLISRGFAFAGQRFSLSLPAQATLLGIDHARNDAALVYPIAYNTIDDSEVFLIPDAATAHGFFLTALGTYRAHKD